MTKLQCDVCGGMLQMDAGGKTATCQNCGMVHSLERVREMLSGVKVSITGSQEDVEQWRQLVHRYYECGDFSAAEQVVKKILEAAPSDIEATKMYNELQTYKFYEIRNGVLTRYTGKSNTLVIPSCVTDVDFCAFNVNATQANFTIEELTIPGSIKRVRSFHNLKTLKKVTIMDGVLNIGSQAFWGCSALQDISIPESVETIEDEAFAYCETLTSINIPNGVTTIGKRAFTNCKKLQEVSLPNSLSAIESESFSSCESLASICIPEGIKAIKEDAFHTCSSLKSVSFPTSLMSIGENAFCGCKSLVSIQIPAGIDQLSEGVFSCCTSLKDVYIPDSVTSIGASAFSCCDSLTEISIPNSVSQIENEAFRWCNSLASIHMSQGISMGRDVFNDCKTLASKWMSMRRCKHCGGNFDGIISKKCHNCHREKDY